MGRVKRGSGSALVRQNRPNVVSRRGAIAVREVTGSAALKYPMERQEDLGEMVRMVLGGKSYREVALELRMKREAMGQEYMITAEMVKSDVERALAEWQAENAGKVEVVIARELAKVADMDRSLAEDYVKSRKVDAKTYVALRKMGMGHDEIMAMDFPGDANIIYTRKVLQDQMLKIMGVKGMKADSGTKNYYNFEGMDKDAMLEVVRGLQDNRYRQVKGIEVKAKDVEPEKVEDDGLAEGPFDGQA